MRDVCARADVGRSTFYLHFESKEKLLTSGFDDLRLMLPSAAPGSGSASGGMFGFAGALAEHVDGHRRLFRAIVGKRSGNIVQARFRQLVVDLVAEDLAGSALPVAEQEATARYIAGALVEMLVWWVESRSSLSPGEMAALFQSLTKGANGPARG